MKTPLEHLVAACAAAMAPVLEDPEVFGGLVADKVGELIAEGTLVPSERLRVGAAAEIAPLGLEKAARAVLSAAGKRKLPDVLRKRLDALSAVLSAQSVAPAPAPEVPVEEEPEVQELCCTVCGTEITADQALVSQSRWRKPLCAEHHASGGKPTTREAPDEPAG